MKEVLVSHRGGKILTLQEAAKIAEMSPPALYAHIRKNRLLRAAPSKRVYGRVPLNVFEDDLKDFIANYESQMISGKPHIA